MKNKIISLAMVMMMFVGVVSASSINGDYKGNPIVKVMSNGKQLQSDEVPAMIYDGHTVVPISLLRQIGASVEWNADTYSVDVKLPQQSTSSFKSVDEVEMFRFLYYANEQASTAFQLMPLMDMMSNSKADYDLVIGKVNSIRTDIITEWSQHLSAKQVYGSDMSKVNQIEKSLVNVKNYLLKLDTKSALAEWNILKPTINDLYGKYDLILINSANATAPSSQTQNAPIINDSIKSNNSQSNLNIQLPIVTTTSAIETTIDGEFTGWTGDTIFKLSNGQIWQQESFDYTYTYDFMPKVLIYKSGSRYKMKVDGVKQTIDVKQLK